MVACEYPTPEAVDNANHVQLAQWLRFLPPPAAHLVGDEFPPQGLDRDYVLQVVEKESRLMDRIVARFRDLGGMTPQLSKAIGW